MSHLCCMMFCMLCRALSSFDDLDFGAVKQNVDSAQKSVDTTDSDTHAELLAGQSWLSVTDALELARHKLLRAVTTLHVEDDLDHARLVQHFHHSHVHCSCVSAKSCTVLCDFLCLTSMCKYSYLLQSTCMEVKREYYQTSSVLDFVT